MTKHNAPYLLASVSTWHDVPDNPVQRDSAAHYEKVKHTHLAAPAQSHSTVHAARLPNGRFVKLDGHTRDYAWHHGFLKPYSDTLTVVVYPVASMAEAIELYYQFDSPTAVETTNDRVYSALKEAGAKEIKIAEYRGLATALLLLTGTKFNREVVKLWAREIEIVRVSGLAPKARNASLYAAMLATVRVHGEDALPFWKAYFSGDVKQDGTRKCDARRLLDHKVVCCDVVAKSADGTHTVVTKRAPFGLGNDTQRRAGAAIAVACAERWLTHNGRTFGKDNNPAKIVLADYVAAK